MDSTKTYITDNLVFCCVGCNNRKNQVRLSDLINILRVWTPRKMKKARHGGAQEESKLVQKYADQWCKDNGYPTQRRLYIYKGKWVKNERRTIKRT